MKLSHSILRSIQLFSSSHGVEARRTALGAAPPGHQADGWRPPLMPIDVGGSQTYERSLSSCNSYRVLFRPLNFFSERGVPMSQAQRMRWLLVFVVVVCATLIAIRRSDAQGGGLPALEDKVKKLEARIVDLEKRTVKYDDRIALKTRADVYIGATDGKGEVNTQTPLPGHGPREVAGADETFTVDHGLAK